MMRHIKTEFFKKIGTTKEENNIKEKKNHFGMLQLIMKLEVRTCQDV